MPKLAENVALSWDREGDRVILKKLQKLAPFMYLKVNSLAKKLLHEAVDKQLQELGITDCQQPAAYVG